MHSCVTYEEISLDLVDGRVILIGDMIGCNEHPKTSYTDHDTLNTHASVVVSKRCGRGVRRTYHQLTERDFRSHEDPSEEDAHWDRDTVEWFHVNFGFEDGIRVFHTHASRSIHDRSVVY